MQWYNHLFKVEMTELTYIENIWNDVNDKTTIFIFKNIFSLLKSLKMS